jgi:hypothetical protein
MAEPITDVADGVPIPMTVHEYFTCGRCWELAEAMVEARPQARIIEIRVSNGSWNMLVHAGIEHDGQVIDIEGRHELTQWVDRWSANWDSPEVSYRKGRGETLGFENRRTMRFARLAAARLLSAIETEPQGVRANMKKAA